MRVFAHHSKNWPTIGSHTMWVVLEFCSRAVSEKIPQIFSPLLPAKYVIAFSGRTDAEMWPNRQTHRLTNRQTNPTLTAHAYQGYIHNPSCTSVICDKLCLHWCSNVRKWWFLLHLLTTVFANCSSREQISAFSLRLQAADNPYSMGTHWRKKYMYVRKKTLEKQNYKFVCQELG